MNFKQTVAGQRKKWTLIQKLGEGDAGEVYLVEAFLEDKPAILKRPRRGTFPSDILRQAAQISTEGQLLKALEGIPLSDAHISLATPGFLDQSPPEDGRGEGFFIVIEQAAGIDLKSLLRLARSSRLDQAQLPAGEDCQFFLQTMAEWGQIPRAILVRALSAVIHLLERIHYTETRNDGLKQSGLIWNDIKPEHLYWDPARARLTVIDWGNGKFLEADGATRDRQHSRTDDYHQFVQEMGAFVAEADPELHAQLAWPKEIAPGKAYSEGVQALAESLSALHQELLLQVKEVRSEEADLYGLPQPALHHLERAESIHRRLVTLGELPDFSSAETFYARLALQMTAENNLAGFQQICAHTAQLATSHTEKWQMLGQIASIAQAPGAPDDLGMAIAGALPAGVADDWDQLLWDLFVHIGQGPLPEWWEPVSQGVRRVFLGLEEDALLPDVAIRRLFYTLQTTVLQSGDRNRPSAHAKDEAFASELTELEELHRLLNEEVVKKWKEIAPPPPNAGIGYEDIDELAQAIEAILPGTRQKLEQVLAQPRAHATIVLDAWEHRDFETARRGLHRLLVWDPARRRILAADRAISAASRWLADVRQGAGKDEPFYDYLSSIELAGRNLRNRVGPATWLDTILEALKRLRKGHRPADLLIGHPELSEEIPWLNEFRSREILSLPRTHALTIARDEYQTTQPPKTVVGVMDGRLGPDQHLHLGDPLDTWLPEARGSSARVFSGRLRNRDNQGASFAIKIMRPDQVEYALPLFKEEAQILSVMRDVPGITPLVECGFLKFEDGQSLPGDERHASAAHLTGSVIRYGIEEVQNYLASLERQAVQGWLPYLALVARDQHHNLVHYCDAGSTRGWFLPLRESLLLAIQICDLLQVAHERNIMYRDHKILHYYWEPATHGVVMIDWNIAKRQSQGLTEAERKFDLVQLGARALHHIMTGRPAPGALPLGPNRPEEIERAMSSYTVNWTYDDERLPNQLKEILERLVTQGYHQVRDLRADLEHIYQQIPDSAQLVQPTQSEAG